MAYIKLESMIQTVTRGRQGKKYTNNGDGEE